MSTRTAGYLEAIEHLPEGVGKIRLNNLEAAAAQERYRAGHLFLCCQRRPRRGEA